MADDEERADLAERAADLVAGALGSALDAIGRQAIVDCYHALFGDRLTAKRIKNLAEVFKVYQDQTKHLPPEGKRFIAEKIGVRLIQEASLEDEPQLQKLWGNLLAAAASQDKPDLTVRHVTTAKELMPHEVALLHDGYKHVKKTPSGYLGKWLTFHGLHSRIHREDMLDTVAHLIGLGIIKRVEFKVRARGSLQLSGSGPPSSLVAVADHDTVQFTKFGWDFVCAAVEGASAS